MKIEVWLPDSVDTIIIESDIIPQVGDHVFLDDREIYVVVSRGISLKQSLPQKDRLHDITLGYLK